MVTSLCDLASADALTVGKAILKYISANNVGLTGGHECGYYLPKAAWRLFTPHAPTKGANAETAVQVTWHDGTRTDSRVKWYGNKTRSEYRLTRFGRDFRWLQPDMVGNLLVLVPASHTEFRAYVLETEEDFEEIQARLGVEILEGWGVYLADAGVPESDDECLTRRFREFAAGLTEFPPSVAFSTRAISALSECVKGFARLDSDKRLVEGIDAEYRLFRLVEQQLCASAIRGPFGEIDAFLKVAGSITNRRKSRAGYSLEHHVQNILTRAEIPFATKTKIEGNPDILIPSEAAYDDESYSAKKLLLVGLKTTCKDRWRQITQEAPRAKGRFLLTLQHGISTDQVSKMRKAGIQLVVPTSLHSEYPPDTRDQLLTVESFISEIRDRLGMAG